MDAVAEARGKLKEAHRALSVARGTVEVAKGALDRAKAHVDAIGRELAALVAVQDREVAADAETLVGRLRAGLVGDAPHASRAGVEARAKRGEVEARHAAADLAYATLANEARSAQAVADAAERDHAGAVAALLKVHGNEIADRLVADAARLKFAILDFQTSGLPVFDHPHLFTIGDLGGMLGALRADRPASDPVDWQGYRARLMADPDATPIPA